MKYKKWIAVVCGAVVALGWSWGTKQKEMTTRTVSVGSFDKIHITGDFDVVIHAGEKNSVQLLGPVNIIEKVSLQAADNTLGASYVRSGWNKKMPRLRLKISVSAFKEVNLEARSQAKLQGPFSGAHFAVYASGHSEFSAENINVHSLHIVASDEADVDIDQLQAESVDVRANGQAEVELSGLAHEATLENKGSGKLDAEDLRVHSGVVRLEGKGDVKVSAYEKLHALVLGKGNIFYKGSPVSVHKEGNVRQIVPDLED